MKRVFDIVVSLTGLFLLSPVIIVLALLIGVTSPGGVFYRQRRVGKDGMLFDMLKFRSMRPDADKTGSYQTARNDPRITPIGSWLRRTSLDEIPQLLNVVKGDMSLVGPRPDVLEQRDLYTAEEWKLRHTVKPGITGIAQSTLRSDATPEQRKKLDIYYVENSSFLFDVKILSLTLKQLFTRGGF